MLQDRSMIENRFKSNFIAEEVCFSYPFVRECVTSFVIASFEETILENFGIIKIICFETVFTYNSL